jgi:NADH dehydrogenase FAD-containing subunit
VRPAAGRRAPPPPPHGRLATDERLAVPGHHGIFAAGDIAAVRLLETRVIPVSW